MTSVARAWVGSGLEQARKVGNNRQARQRDLIEREYIGTRTRTRGRRARCYPRGMPALEFDSFTNRPGAGAVMVDLGLDPIRRREGPAGQLG